jgi:phage major head subunit gpT-like protein
MAIQSGYYGKLLEPGLRKIFFETYKEKPEQYPNFVNILTSEKAIETDARFGGFSQWNKKGTLDATEYEDPSGKLTTTYKHDTFSKGFQVEKELVDDEQYNIINKMPKALARAARATIEQNVSTLLTTSFTASPTNPNGEALISGTHALLGAQGGTTSNLIGALTLSEANLEVALKLASQQVDERGLKIQVMPDTLIVPRALEFTAEKIVKSVQLPGTNNNDINPLQGRFKVVVLDYLTSDTNWWMVDSTMNPLNFFWREKLNFKSENDFDTDAAKYKGRMRFSYGWTDYRGIFGSNA